MKKQYFYGMPIEEIVIRNCLIMWTSSKHLCVIVLILSTITMLILLVHILC